MKPMSDLGWVCQQNSTAIMRAANRPEEEKSINIHANVCSVVMYAQVGIIIHCTCTCHADHQTN